MNWRDYLIITLLGAVVLGVTASFLDSPGYMDAEYYYGMGIRIAKYGELSEPFIWNYLTEVQTIPHPGFSYWMPLPALVASIGMWITGIFSFSAARSGPIAIAMLIPAVSMGLCYRLTGKRLISWLAGLLAVFPAFYNIFFTTTDSFGVMMLLGGFYLLTALGNNSRRKFIVLGLLTGLLHLTRPDGLLWFAAGLLLVYKSDKKKWESGVLLIIGYLLVMGPWFIRNISVLGEILPGASSKVLWLRDYDELFLFQTRDLNFKHWYSQGWVQIFRNIVTSVWVNLKTLLFVQGQLALFPLILLGLRKYWRNTAVQSILIVWGLDFLLMSVVFPFAGMRGGYLHSGSGFQPLFWSLSAAGFAYLIAIGVRERNWTSPKAELLFGASLVVIISLGSVYLFKERVIGPDTEQPLWNVSNWVAKDIGFTLHELDLEGLVMINNPPGFYTATGRSAVVIPSGGVPEILQAANKFGVDYLILEPNHASPLDPLYTYPEIDPDLVFITSRDGIKFFRIAKE